MYIRQNPMAFDDGGLSDPADTAAPSADREAVSVTYYPVLKNHALGRRMTKTVPARRGENPFLAAERALRRAYKVKDYVILDARLSEFSGLRQTADLA
ncbi:MAG: hypothetical protein VW268_11050 [Rhodospirillaceae bacterium]